MRKGKEKDNQEREKEKKNSREIKEGLTGLLWLSVQKEYPPWR